jgi:membrane-associated protease RseP (regulator of RpoE activity)
VSLDALWSDYVYVRGTMEGMPGWFLVDSGATYGATRKSVFAALTKAHPRPTLTGFYTPAQVGTFWSDVATLGAVEAGGVAVDGILTRTIDDDILAPPKEIGSDTLLGVLPSGYLHHFMVTVDFTKKKLRLDAKKDDTMKEAPELFVTGISLEETTGAPVHVTSVLPGSAAAEAGIAAGDELVSIDGAPIAGIAPFDRSFRLASPTNGHQVTVEVAHGGTTTSHALVTRDLLTF